jgi:hypothetical protein
MAEDAEFNQAPFHFTEEDFALIDRLSVNHIGSQTVENPQQKTNPEVHKLEAPFHRYHRTGVLSVTDVVAPAWLAILNILIV